MSHISFKQFNSYLDLPEDASADQLQEIFGLFSNPDKVKELEKKKAELKSAEFAARRKIAQQRDKMAANRFATLKPKTPRQPNQLDKLQTHQMRAGQLRAIDRNPFGVED